MRDLVFIYDYICPYCYLMFSEVQKVGKLQNIRIRWVPIELFPQTPQRGVLLEKILGVQKKYKIEREIIKISKEKNIPYYQPETLYNTHIARLLTDFTSMQTNGERTAEVAEELFNRVFIYNENIGDWNVLYKICIHLALDFEKFKKAVNQPYLGSINSECRRQFLQSKNRILPKFIIDFDTEIEGLYMDGELQKKILETSGQNDF